MSFARPEWGGLDTFSATMKQKFRWFFRIPNITGDIDNALPCIRAARPKLQFREMQAEHLNETIFFPSKPDWQPISIMLYDRCITNQNPIFTWLKAQYNPSPADQYGCSSWWPSLMPLSFKPCATLELYDGCGSVVEAWTLENVYPQSIDWGELDMGNSEIVTVELSLRYDRAYQTFPIPLATLYDQTDTENCGGSCDNPPDCNLPNGQASSIIIPPPETPNPGGGTTPGQIPNISIDNGQTTTGSPTTAPDLSGFTPGESLYSSALGATVTPYAAPGQPTVYYDPSSGNYWRQSGRIGSTIKWQKWTGSDWGRSTITPQLKFANLPVTPDFAFI